MATTLSPRGPRLRGAQPGTSIDADEIRRLLPHRWPFLLVDRVKDCVPGESAVGLKNVALNESVFQGHFPDQSIMPGVLIIEALAQTCGIVVTLGNAAGGPQSPGRGFLATVRKMRFLTPVRPGDQIELRVRKDAVHAGVVEFATEAWVAGRPVATGHLVLAT